MVVAGTDSGHPAATIEAPLVFAGYGLSIPEAHWDDLKGLHLRGAGVVFLAGGPERIDGNLRSHYSSNAERWKALKIAGAVGTIAIQNPKAVEVPAILVDKDTVAKFTADHPDALK